MPQKKKQHYVPSFYLNHFTVKQDKENFEDYLWIYEKPTKKVFKRAPKNIGFQNYFYSVKVEEEISSIIEDGLAEIESEVAALFLQIINGRTKISDLKERYNFGRFICFLNYRTVKADTIFNILNQNVLKDAFVDQMNHEGGVEEYLNKHGKDWSPERFVDSFNKMKLKLPKEMKLHLMINAAARMIPSLCVRKWSFLKVHSNSIPFITSDHPVILYNANCPQDNFMPGYYLKETEIFFPISPEICFYASFSTKEGTQLISNEEVIKINTKINEFANQYLFSNKSGFQSLFLT